jgi:hypothetical protein
MSDFEHTTYQLVRVLYMDTSRDTGAGCDGYTAVIDVKHPLVAFMAAHSLDGLSVISMDAYDARSDAEDDGYADCPQLSSLSASQLDAYWAVVKAVQYGQAATAMEHLLLPDAATTVRLAPNKPLVFETSWGKDINDECELVDVVRHMQDSDARALADALSMVDDTYSSVVGGGPPLSLCEMHRQSAYRARFAEPV